MCKRSKWVIAFCGLLAVLAPTFVSADVIIVDPGADEPREAIFSPDGQLLYVATGAGSMLTVVRMSDLAVIDRVHVGGDPLGVVLTPDGLYLYVTNTCNLYSTTKIDVASREILACIPGGTDPAHVALTPDSKTACITSHWSSFLQIVDVETDDEIGRVYGISHGGNGIVVTPDGEFAYVVARSTGPSPGSGVYRVSLVSQSIASVIPVSGAQIDITPDGSEVWVPNYTHGNTVTVIDTYSDAVKTVIPIGNPAFDVAIDPGANFAYVTLHSVDSVSQIDMHTYQVTATLAVGDGPDHVNVSSDGTLIIVANQLGNTLSLLHPSDFVTTQHAHLDVKPGSCPNPLNIGGASLDDIGPRSGSNMAAGGGGDDPAVSEGNRGKKAVLPVAILGTDEFDVAQIDAATVLLEGVSPVRWNYEDVATPMPDDADQCDCHDLGPDGWVDMTLKFDKAEVVAVLGELSDGDVVPLTISGQLIDGTPFEGVDCVIIRAGGNDQIACHDGPSDGVMNAAVVNNYPNPFNPWTTISFRLPVASEVTLTVYNVMGQKVATVADGFYEAGEHDCTWDGSTVASGVYFYRLETPGYAETRKMILMK